MPGSIIFKLAPSDLPGPLRQFQATEFKEEDFRKLLKTINSTQGELKLADMVLNEVFDMWWPRLQGKFNDILAADEVPENTTPIRTEREMLEEILELSRLYSRQRVVSSKIHPGAVREMVKFFKEAVDAIQGDTEPQAALTALSSMCPALDYLVLHCARREMIDELRALKFEYQASDEEDEIPF